MADPVNGRHHSWREAFLAYLDKRVAAMLFLGFSAGMPLLLVFSTLSVWLREAEVERATITFFAWAGLGYGFKFVWAPLVDKLPVPMLAKVLGPRRAWLLVAQAAIIAALLLMGRTDPLDNLALMAVFAVMLGFSSATQDIVIDAYRIEAAEVELQGLMSSMYIAGYRIGMLVAGAGALEIAGWLDPGDGYQYGPWATTYTIMAGAMGIGVLTTLSIKEPAASAKRATALHSGVDYARFVGVFAVAAAAFVAGFVLSADAIEAFKDALAPLMGVNLGGFVAEAARLAGAVAGAVLAGWIVVKLGLAPKAMVEATYVAPFREFFTRFGTAALIILALIATYRIADVVMGVMANIFYVDIGFDKQEIGRVTKGFGLIMTIVGGFLGGTMMVRFGVIRVLTVGAILAAGTNVLFAILAMVGNDIWMLIAVIAADNLSAGIASAAFVAYLSGLTSTAFTATQYALFSSIMMLLPKLISGYSGMAVDQIGYVWFFVGTALLGIPVLALIWAASRVRAR